MHDRSSLFRLPAEGIVRATNPAPTLDPSFAVGVRIAERFLASAVLRSGRALRGYWRGLPGRAQKLFRLTSLRMSMSTACSATIFLRRAFSDSSSFRRFIASAFMPP